MDAELTIKNYRCFPDSRPARIVVRDGFTAFLGVNNSGKSSLLKFFYEFRSLFGMMSASNGHLQNAVNGQHQAFTPPYSGDMEGLFCNHNNRDIEITIKSLDKRTRHSQGYPIPEQLILTVFRGTNTFTLQPHIHGVPECKPGSWTFNGSILNIQHIPRSDFDPYFELCQELASTLYIGPFRNAINVGTMPSYFDIAIGQEFIKRWKHLKSAYPRRQNEAILRLTDDIRRIFEFRQLEINGSPDDQTLQFFVNDRSYSLGELGAGLAQFVMVLANAATRQPAFILIDEPELNLHPSLQLDFLTTLGSYAKRGRIVRHP